MFGLPTDGGEVMLVASKTPDAQAAMEKSACCALAKAHGFKHLEGAGMLWIDEVFSPQQLMIDIEIARFVSATDIAIAPASGDITAEIRAGLDAGSFLGSELMLERFREFAWDAELSDLGPRGSWAGDHTTLLAHATELARAKADAYPYELSDHRREAIDALIARVMSEFSR
jgi:trimethylamine:corrinoid methyltransferase-like protein